MHRRRFIASLGSAIALPCIAAAQQRALPVIGYLHFASPGSKSQFLHAFRQGLSESGCTHRPAAVSLCASFRVVVAA